MSDIFVTHFSQSLIVLFSTTPSFTPAAFENKINFMRKHYFEIGAPEGTVLIAAVYNFKLLGHNYGTKKVDQND